MQCDKMPGKEKDSENHTVRIGNNFHKEIENIQEERLDSGIDKKKKSMRVLSNLLVRHKLWNKIKQEMIEVNLNDE